MAALSCENYTNILVDAVQLLSTVHESQTSKKALTLQKDWGFLSSPKANLKYNVSMISR